VEFASHLKNGVQDVNAAQYVVHFSLSDNIIGIYFTLEDSGVHIGQKN